MSRGWILKRFSFPRGDVLSPPVCVWMLPLGEPVLLELLTLVNSRMSWFVLSPRHYWRRAFRVPSKSSVLLPLPFNVEFACFQGVIDVRYSLFVVLAR